MSFARCAGLSLPILFVVASCSNGGSSGTASSREQKVAPRAVEASTVLEKLSSYSAIKDALSRRTTIAAGARGFVRTNVAGSAALVDATLPLTAAAPLHLVPRLDDGAWADVRALDANPVSGTLHDNAVVYENAGIATDVVMTAEPGRAEETRLLRDASAPTTFRYQLDLGPSIVDAHVRSGMVELADAKGYVHLSTDVAFAIDANGVKRELTVTLEGEGRSRTMTVSLDATGLAYPIAVDPVWTTAPSHPGGPRANIAISLNTGRVLVLGGYSPYAALYNPATNTWTGGTLGGIPNVPIAYSGPPFLRATKLASGDVLVLAAGATDNSFAIFRAATNTWTVPTNKQVYACNGCGVVTLPSGMVFKVNGASATTEQYNPSTGLWSTRANAPVSSGGERLLFALRGTTYANWAFVFGGDPAQSAGFYNANTNTWSGLIGGRRFVGPNGVALNDGRVLIGGMPSGGSAPPQVATIFNPATSTYTDTSLTPLNLANPGYVLLSSGLVLGAGGQTTGSSATASRESAIYDPTSGIWSTVDQLPTGQAEQAMVEMTNKAVLAVGGVNNYGSAATTAQIFTPLAQGASCAAPLRPQTCVTGFCVNNVCCTTASCPNGVCNAPAVAGRAAGVCALNNGRACTANSQCASNFCVDGVCCNSACTGQCEACNGAGTAGTCTAVTGAPTAPRPACSGVGAGTPCGPTCNGTNRTSCTYAPAGTIACGMAGCTGGTMTTASKCNGAGVCPSTSTSCGAYACGPTACLTTCTNDAFCAAGYFCDMPSSTCVPKTGLGVPCTTSATCSAGTFCTDGVCCGVASCGAGSSCALGTAGGAIAPGTCSKINGTACTSDAECGSQHCVDGVCCNTACTDQCAACDVSGKEGTCSPVTGKPHGTTRPACDDGGTNKCAAKQCDGTSATSACNGFVNDGTVKCAEPACMGSSLLPAAYCDGAGACGTATVSSCGKYVCDTTALACKTTCSTNADCANDAVCKSGVCTDAATCSTDGNKSIDPVTKAETDCAPYKCGSSGACSSSCATSNDCQAGSTCDTTSGTGICVAAAAPGTDSSGGCAFGGNGGPWSPIAIGALGLAAASIGARRRRRVAR